ncbi:DUF881 domain-containing protein [Actinomycetota bacterium]
MSQQTPDEAATEVHDPTLPERGVTGRRAWETLFRMARPRATRANIFASLLALALGFALATQVRSTTNAGLETLREPELIRILDDVTEEDQRLQAEQRSLEAQRDRLLSGQGSSDEAVRSAQERARSLGVLAGTTAATGPGMTMTIPDPTQQVTAAHLLDALEELRDAGAEAVQIGPVRVVASTHFTDAEGGVAISGKVVQPPYVFKVIGDPATMSAAMDIPGGVRESMRRLGTEATIVEQRSLEITALHQPAPRRYARPVPSPSPTSS